MERAACFVRQIAKRKMHDDCEESSVQYVENNLSLKAASSLSHSNAVQINAVEDIVAG